MRVRTLDIRRVATIMLAAATLGACGGGGDDGVTEPTPTIDITLSATTLSVQQGANGTVNLTLSRGGGFTGAVTVAVTGAPTGVTATPAPSSIASGSTSSVITVAAGATTAPGTYNLVVHATGAGVTEKTATIALTVTAAPASNFTIALDPTTRSIAQGANGTITVNITRTNFTGAVNLTAEGLPTGVTAAFNPASVTTNSSTLTLTAAANAAVGTSTVTVRAAATGQPEKTATFELTITAPTSGSFTLAVNEATVSIAQGATGTANITLTRTGGFNGAVALTAENLPSGVTASFNPASVTGTTSVLTLTVAANAAPASASVLVRGTSQGQQDKSATFLLTITAAPTGGFTLALNPASLTVQQGTSGNTTVTITRTAPFAGTVNLAASGLPNGVTASFNPAAATGGTSTLTLTAAANAAVGQATVTITGTGTGVANQTTTLTLDVTAQTGGSGNTTWEFCTAGETPIWLAVQDGNGAWTRVNPTGTKFQFDISQGRGGVAFVTGGTAGSVSSARRSFAQRVSAQLERELVSRNRPSRVRRSAYAARSLADNFELTVFYGTQAELNASGTGRCLPGSGKTLNGTVAGLSGQQSAAISLGSASASVQAPNTTYQLTDVPDGALDLIASRTLTQFSGTGIDVSVDRMILRRGQNFANNATIPVLDFNAAEAFAPAVANLTIGNLGADLGFAFSAFFSAAGSSAAGATIFAGGLPGGGPFKYYGVPTNKLVAGDLHVAQAFAFSNSGDQIRFAGVFFKDPTDRTVTLGAALGQPNVSVAATTPYARLRAQGTVAAEYNKSLEITFDQANVAAVRSVAITVMEGYLSGSTTFDFAVPDFSGVAGWDNNWGLKAGQETDWMVIGVGYSGIGYGSSHPVEGSTFQAAGRIGSITP